MDPSNITMTQWILIGGGLGLLTGLVPLILGFVKKNLKVGLLGFFGSIIGGAVLGLLLAIPVAGIFTWLILRSSVKSAETENAA
ncbi:MAG: hypothetical protein IPL32_05860 [Chloracidobacterium sp.]|nr:hypothetical protein [Chloracidobacterium sp.]